MNQGGNPFALAETGIQNQYTHAKSMILSLCQIMLFKKQQSHSGHKSYLSTIDPQPPPSSTYGKKRVGNSSAKVDQSVPQEQIVWYDQESKKNKQNHICAWACRDQPIDRIGPNPTARQTK